MAFGYRNFDFLRLTLMYILNGKVSGIRSYIETCKRNNIKEYIALVRLLEGVPYTLEEILKSSKN